MAVRGDKWVDELVGDVAFTSAARREAARKQLKEMVALLNRLDEAAPSPSPIVLSNIFDKPGWFAVRYDKLASPAELKAAGIEWVAAILSHGVNADGSHNLDADDKTNQAWLAAGKAKPYRDAGIKVGGWMWHEKNPESEAAIAETYIDAWDLDLWIANAEDVWKPDAGTRFVTNGPERFAVAFVERARLNALPMAFPVAWSVLGAAVPPNVYAYDYRAFTSRGWRILPQAYPQQSPEYKLSIVIDHAVTAQIDLALLHPTIAAYEPQKPDAFKPSIATWITELQAAAARGVTGHSFWAHDFSLADVKRINESV